MDSEQPGMTKEIWDDLSEAATRRAEGWRCLALGLDEPSADLFDPGFLDSLDDAISWVDKDRAKFDAAEKILIDFLESNNGVGPDTKLEELKSEYARLFQGADSALPPLLERLYRPADKQEGGSPEDVRQAYEEAGFQPPEAHADAPDHLSTECDFMHYLCHHEAEAWLSGDFKAKDYRLFEHRFIYGHIMMWLPSLCSKLQTAARSKFYWGLAEFGKQYLAIETGGIQTLRGQGGIFPGR